MRQQRFLKILRKRKVILNFCFTAFAVFCVSPIEMVRTKLQSKKNLSYTQLYNVVENALKQEGVLSLWRGIGPTLLRDVPFSGNFELVWQVELYERN